MKKVLVLLLIAILLSAANLAGFAIHAEPALAAGTSTLTITASAYRYYWTDYGAGPRNVMSILVHRVLVVLISIMILVVVHLTGGA